MASLIGSGSPVAWKRTCGSLLLRMFPPTRSRRTRFWICFPIVLPRSRFPALMAKSACVFTSRTTNAFDRKLFRVREECSDDALHEILLSHSTPPFPLDFAKERITSPRLEAALPEAVLQAPWGALLLTGFTIEECSASLLVKHHYCQALFIGF